MITAALRGPSKCLQGLAAAGYLLLCDFVQGSGNEVVDKLHYPRSIGLCMPRCAGRTHMAVHGISGDEGLCTLALFRLTMQYSNSVSGRHSSNAPALLPLERFAGLFQALIKAPC